MKQLRETIQEAEEKKIAIGHFNISNIEGLWAVFRAAQKYNVPVIIGLSGGECSFIGARQAMSLVKSLREQYNYPIYINADHTYTFEKVKEIADIGFDSVAYDGVKLSYKENIETTKKCVEYVKSVNPGILIEAEIGFIGSSSKILDEIPEGAGISSEMFTTPMEAKKFVNETGIDLFAPSVGNIHGMFKNAPNPSLDIARVKEIKEATGVPLVLHGGSGISDEDFRGAIQAGIRIIHINTEIRLAYHDALVKSLKENPDEIAPYRIMKPVIESMQSVVERRIRLFSGLD